MRIFSHSEHPPGKSRTRDKDYALGSFIHSNNEAAIGDNEVMSGRG